MGTHVTAKTASAAVDAEFPRARGELERLVQIPSVSAAGFDPRQVRRSADATAGLLEGSGFTDVRPPGC